MASLGGCWGRDGDGDGGGIGAGLDIVGGWLGWERDVLVAVLGWAGLDGLDWERKRGMRMDATDGVSWRGLGLGAGGIQ